MAVTDATHKAIRDGLSRLCLSTGRYKSGGTHEPTRAPGAGLTYAIFVRREVPIPDSGLNSTSTCMTWVIQNRLPITYEPKDDIDLKLLGAASDVIRRLMGDFDLAVPEVRSLDARGRFGQPVGWESGYLHQDNIWYRIFDVFVPLVINDSWLEAT